MYANITLDGTTQQHAVAALAGQPAFVSKPFNGRIVVFEKRCDTLDLAALVELAADLSVRLSCSALAVLGYDGDSLWLQLFRHGVPGQAYESKLDHPHSATNGVISAQDDVAPVASELATGLGMPEAAVGLIRILSANSYSDETSRHWDLAAVLALPDIAVGCGFDNFEDGEYPDDYDEADFVRVA